MGKQKMSAQEKADKMRGLLFDYDSLFAQMENMILGNPEINNKQDMIILRAVYQVMFRAIHTFEAQIEEKHEEDSAV